MNCTLLILEISRKGNYFEKEKVCQETNILCTYSHDINQSLIYVNRKISGSLYNFIFKIRASLGICSGVC